MIKRFLKKIFLKLFAALCALKIIAKFENWPALKRENSRLSVIFNNKWVPNFKYPAYI